MPSPEFRLNSGFQTERLGVGVGAESGGGGREELLNLLDQAGQTSTLQRIIWLLERFSATKKSDSSVVENKIYADDGSSVSPEDILSDLETLEVENIMPNPTRSKNLYKIKKLYEKAEEVMKRRLDFKRKYEVDNSIQPSETFPFTYPVEMRVIDRPKTAGPEAPIYIDPGYSVGVDSVARNAIGLAELGRQVMVAVAHPRERYFDKTQDFPSKTASYNKTRASVILSAMKVGIDKFFVDSQKYDVIGYSQGAVNALVAATLRPEIFRSIVLLNPAGFTHRDLGYLSKMMVFRENYKHHEHQVLSEADSDYRRKSMFKEFGSDMQSHYEKGGWVYKIRTVDAIFRSRPLSLVNNLLKRGVRLGVLFSEKDKVFPASQVEQSSLSAGLDSFPISGGHSNLGFEPGGVSEICEDMFKYLNENNKI